VEEAAVTLGVDGMIIPDLVLAADEATTNVIMHGYRQCDGPLELSLMREGLDLVLQIRDRAQPFDPTCVPPPDLTIPLEARAPGGLGVYLIRQLMDDVMYRRLDDGVNELVLTKRNAF
jgi:anti-sigma regulatory factor (Ser/Thr protein kinase)